MVNFSEEPGRPSIERTSGEPLPTRTAVSGNAEKKC